MEPFIKGFPWLFYLLPLIVMIKKGLQKLLVVTKVFIGTDESYFQSV